MSMLYFDFILDSYVLGMVMYHNEFEKKMKLKFKPWIKLNQSINNERILGKTFLLNACVFSAWGVGRISFFGALKPKG